MSDVLRRIIRDNRAGRAVAIASVCSAHPDVIRASLRLAQKLDRPVVIEATSNQVNQDGGYTGMTPRDFIAFVGDLAVQAGCDRDRITFGGDHLGPQAWRKLPADQAMAKAHVMVRDYVAAGFTKIHLDCSEGLLGEPAQLGDDITVARSAALAQTCENVGVKNLLYVVGTEVPPPGGARGDDHGDIPATTPQAARATLDAHLQAFQHIGEIGGLVVQPGVEFTPMHIHHLPRDRDPQLRQAIAHTDGVCLEAHSTDYQTPDTFPRLARMGFAFQKVGPALTFAWRQALYGLDSLRPIAGWGDPLVIPVMEDLMTRDPSSWQGHYHGTPDALRVMRHVGLADRIRYYWPRPAAVSGVTALLADLGTRDLASPLLWQACDARLLDLAEGIPGPRPQAILEAAVQAALVPYFFDEA